MDLLHRIQAKKPLFRIVQRRPESPNIYNRKEKSLEELSRRFLRQMIDHDTKTVFLDRLTEQLDVERRRLYDIINILESLRVVTRCCKNQYNWNGFRTIYLTIKNQLNNLQEPTSSRKEKSLEVLSVGFLRLFHQVKVWTLEDAAKQLSPVGTDEAKLKTRIRRLYDIANVLKSIGLIRKVQTDKRAGYEWVGEEGLDAFQQEIKKLPFQETNDHHSEPSSPQKKVKLTKPSVPVSQYLELMLQIALRRQLQQQLTEKKENIDTTQKLLGPMFRQTVTIIHPPKRTTPRKLQDITDFHQ